MTAEQTVATAAKDGQPPKKVHTRNAIATAKGGGIIASGNLFAYGMRFVLAYLMARALGADQYGLYNIALSTATVVAGVAVLGLHTALVRYVAIYARKRDEEELWGLLQVGIGLTLFLSTLLAIGLFAFSYVVANNIYHRPDLVPLIQIMAVVVPFMTLNMALGGATQGFKKMHYAVIAEDFIQTLVRLILIAIMFFIGMKAIHAVAIFGLANIMTTGLLFYFLHREFPLVRSLRYAKRNWREILGFSLPVWFSGLLRTFRSNIQTVLLGSFYTAAGVGIFNVVSRLNLIGRMSLNSISTSARPLLAEIDASDDRAQLANVYHTTGRWAFTINLPIFLTMWLFSEGILVIFGQDFVAGAMALRLLALAELVDALTGICGAIIDMTGLTRLKMINSVIQLALSIGTNVWLIPRYGLMGAAVGALIVNAAINLLRMVQVWYIYRILPFNRTFLKPVASSLVAAGVGFLTLRLTGGSQNLLLLILQTILLFAVFAAATYLVGLPDEERAVLGELRHKIARRRMRTA